MDFEIIDGDLLGQDVDAIVNAWNRNIIPWWLLLPHGVSGAIKKRGGTEPFREIGRKPLPLGEARLTNAGKLPFKAIIHVAAINGWWRANEYSIRASVRSAIKIVDEKGFESVAFPLLGSGAGSFSGSKSLELICDELNQIESAARAVVVRFRQ